MYWTIGSFPELEHLAPHERAQVMQRVPWWIYLAIVGRYIIPAALIGAIVAVGIFQEVHAAGWPAFLVTMIGALILGYAYELRRLRRSLQRTIIEAFRGQRLPFCIACGYDLRAATSGTCPECGAGVMVRRSVEAEQRP